ncbi:glycosyltransferase [uncultured Fusobacterium sp.]|uniref:glycosyltransferase n=1 Tax=uncultured Fusobacterium sp. TaxID=159267 RepID=UPI00265EF1A5|nr:glycosyltransferase [uncultured Fusobacterium sp.]
MKILSFSKDANPEYIGGIETFQRNLYKIFGKDIEFITLKGNKEKHFKIDNITEIDLEKNKIVKFLLKIISKSRYLHYFIKKYIKQNNIEVLILNSPNDIRKNYKLNCKKILIQHSSWDYYQKTVFTKQLDFPKIIRNYIDYYVFLSKYDQERFVKELQLDINKTKVIRHCCELEILKKTKIKNKKLIIIARIENFSKRIDLAIKVMKKLPDFTLDIYGIGPDEKMLKQMVIDEKLQERVFFKGATNKVKEKLDEASIFIMTSDYEGYGITNIEAMMRGLPIILRNTFESAPDIVQNNGVLLEKEWDEDKFVEAVYKVYENYDYYSKNAIEMGKRHTFETIKNEWIEFMNNIKNSID